MRFIKWLIRILSIISISILILFFFGETDFSIPLSFKLKEIIGLLFFPLGVIIGMVIAWWREKIGGLITVISLLGFYIIHLLLWGDMPGGPYFIIFSSPGILFLVYSYIKNNIIPA